MRRFQILTGSSKKKKSERLETKKVNGNSSTDDLTLSTFSSPSSGTSSFFEMCESRTESRSCSRLNSPILLACNNISKLPEKLLVAIIDNISEDILTLAALCLVSKQFYELISSKYLYRHVKLQSKLSLLKFNIYIHSNENAQKRFFVNQIEFINPECQDSMLKYSKYYTTGPGTTIGGAYEIQDAIPTLHGLKGLGSSKSSSTAPNSHAGHGANSYFSGLFSRPENEKLLRKYSKYTYIELILAVIDYLPNLRHITLNDIDPSFIIPTWYSTLNDGSKEFFKKILKNQESMTREDLKSFKLSQEWISEYQNRYHTLPRYKTLELVGKKKQPLNCVLRSFYLFAFGIFEELILENMDIDSQSLECPFEILPLQMKMDEKGYLDVHSPITSLSLNNCNIVVKQGIFKNMHDYFNKVRSLKLLNLKNQHDLLLSNCFPLLQELSIDCNSLCFIADNSVKDSYYLSILQETSSENNHNNDDDDTLSEAETLINFVEEKYSIKYPPPTTPTVITYDLALNELNNDNLKDTSEGAKVTKNQLEYFQSLNISNFYLNYHKFHKFWLKIPNRPNINLKIINIPFTNVFPLAPAKYLDLLYGVLMDDQFTVSAQPILPNCPDESYWWERGINKCFTKLEQYTHVADSTGPNRPVELDSRFINGYRDLINYKDIPNINLWVFLNTLSTFKSVEIHMLRKWLFCTPRTRYDWELLLKPLLNAETSVKVKDKENYTLYNYGLDKSKKVGN